MEVGVWSSELGSLELEVWVAGLGLATKIRVDSYRGYIGIIWGLYRDYMGVI